jgi:cytoskeletal protein RodZ
MALSQDEQRVLAEIERRLAADDPGLASCLTTFRRPGPAAVLRSPRARIIGSLFTVLLVAMVSLMVYAMIPFRTHTPQHQPLATTGAPTNTALSAATSSQPSRTEHSSASVRSTASQGTANRSAAATGTATASAKSPQAKVKPTTVAMLPVTSP